MEISYVGENLISGQLGNLFIILSFVCSGLAAFAYFKSIHSPELESASWKKMARTFFYIHVGSIVGMVSILFYLLFNHHFEYYYVWRHSSTDLAMRYIFSCFWEGQEGSFMLWSLWHGVLGIILLNTSKKWEAGTMTVLSVVQLLLGSMLLGVYVFDIQIGSNPFILLREHPDMLNLPFVQNPEYLNFVEGTGLNPLLQNYWMTIHPPIVFLGFALTLIPFTFAITSLYIKDYTSWLKPALPWTFFGIAVLGLGVLMGGAWAYEALSFGGFWAWDPVENSSLVPWLILVGAGHLMLINKVKPNSMFSTYLFSVLSFLLVMYSSYLTKSGILGETSVHSFADGLPGQLIFILLFLVIGAFTLLAIRFKKLPKQQKEEELWSREFWMFLGALVLLISCFQITFSTSIPVINAIFGTEMAPPTNANEHYNSWQLPLATLVAIFIGIGHYLKYKKTDSKKFFKDTAVSAILSLVITIAVATSLQFQHYYHGLLMFAATYAVVANADYWFRILKGSIKKSGAAIAHIGFGLLLIGALISAGNKEIISRNNSGIEIKMNENENANKENIMLIKGDTVLMGNHFISYEGREKEGHNIYYKVNYYQIDDNGKYERQFQLRPFVQLNEQMGNVPEPATKHFWSRDIFTHVTYADLDDPALDDPNAYEEADTSLVKIGDTLFATNSIIVVKEVIKDIDLAANNLQPDDIAVGLRLEAMNVKGQTFDASPTLVIRQNRLFSIPSEVDPLGLKFNFKKINPETGEFTILKQEKTSNASDFIIMQAIVFPYINILWIGCIIMTLGSIIAVINRVRFPKLRS